MSYIKRIVMQGFKSFVKKTELHFTKEINVILGPNGSGKSNVSDALCFVLGRLSIKSMRATKAKNLIFLGTKAAAPAKDASVEMVFDNSDNMFSLDRNEVSIKRIVRKNGQSIYKINNETKTRQEVLSLLAQAGIDPNGFNIILQGEIQNFARMHSEERRKIIEEVSGISVYETRKAKALKELEKTENKLNEILTILKERTSYLNNLEKERQQALRFKKLEKDSKRFKASIIYSDLTVRQKDKERINIEIDKKNKEIRKIKSQITEIQNTIEDLNQRTASINSKIKESTGLEQESLNREIADLRADLAGLNVKLENHEIKLSEISKQKQDIQNKITETELELRELQKETPTIVAKQKTIDKKKKELEELEEQRKKFYMIKSELKSIKERLSEKTITLKTHKKESEFILKQVELNSQELFDRKSDKSKLIELKSFLTEKQYLLENLNLKERKLEKLSHTCEHEIKKLTELKQKISSLDVCPLCKNKITEIHINEITAETQPKIESLENQIKNSDKELNEIYKKREILKQDLEQIKTEISKRESDVLKITVIKEKQSQLKALQEKIENENQEIKKLEKRKNNLEANFDENSTIEQKYETLQIEVQEISLMNEETIGSEISFKKRGLERAKINLKQLIRDEQDLNEELKTAKKELYSKEENLEKKNQQDQELSKKFQRLIKERDKYQSNVRDRELDISNLQNKIHNSEQEINIFKIEKAKVDAEIENLETEMLEFNKIEIIKANKETLLQRLNKTQEILSRIGSVNLRSLEVYDEVKKEYDSIKEKVDIISKEKEGIFKIIHEIDIKKKKTFLKTLEELNEIFSRNFAQLSTKGHVSLELENRKEPFEGGVNILVKVQKGKYFDVTSLSGGEQTLVALALIFAIQELKPYCFYILDEIDAALDKRNSERLAGLLKKYMQKGQYIVITHNDEIITNATALYGVSMHDGISKVVSLKI